MAAFCLPVSGIEVRLRPPSGAEDILLAEEATVDIRLALAFAGALARLADGAPVGWEALSTADLDAALLAIRQITLGDHVRSSVICGCGERIDIAFRIDDYLAHHSPGRPRGMTPASEPGWYRLEGSEAIFRIPSCADQLAIGGRADAEAELARRCFRPEVVRARDRRRMQAAMEVLAPSLYGDLEGRCPECSTTVRVGFDPWRYVLTELREHAAFVYEEVYLIAGHYRWSEPEILALPRARRARYAELVHDARAGG